MKKIDFYCKIYNFTIKMILELCKSLFEYLLVKLFPQNYEYKVIERINSSGSLIEYAI